MNCPNCKTKIPDAAVLSEAARLNGSRGGRTTGKNKARSKRQATAAVNARWAKYRAGKEA